MTSPIRQALVFGMDFIIGRQRWGKEEKEIFERAFTELDSVEYAADYFASSFFTEQQKLVEREKRIEELTEERNEATRGYEIAIAAYASAFQRGAEAMREMAAKVCHDCGDMLVGVADSRACLQEATRRMRYRGEQAFELAKAIRALPMPENKP